jgi:ATP-dependent exoDNAse (exonuclease V) beta subunit
MSKVSDQAQRETAIDPAGSFIVQAPAGSGKTELLTQRFLRLLATVKAPEEILAITFTRKAAGEMRDRILGALELAADDQPPAEDHKARTWRLAREARQHGSELGWDLTGHPSRLRVMTLDAFNASLTRQLPLLSGLGAPPAISEDQGELHREAARQTLGLLEDDNQYSEPIATLLLHLDNRLDQAADLLAGMLGHRDQWLPRLLGNQAGDRKALEAAMAREIEARLECAREAVPPEITDELVALANKAAEHLARTQPDSPITACKDLDALPGTHHEDLPTWLGLAELLLTKEGTWRKQVNKNQGFPPEAKEEKAHMKALLERGPELEGFNDHLHALRGLPERPEYPDEQWRLLEALTTLLPLAAAQLQLVFAERGEVDYTEVALRAIQALGDEERPTNLALVLDNRIRHILLDEFQDTSTSQYRLVEALTRGWTPDDDHSLFLVGDPMQSIYRFREAEVGLFLRARRMGIGDLPLEPLRLTANFRSHESLVGWVNEAFPQLLADEEDAAAGAVPFERAEPTKADDDAGVDVHPSFGEDPDAESEAEDIAALARTRLDETEDGTVAILVRARAHAAAIIPALRRAGLTFQCVETEFLASRPVVQDLLALTRALVHDGDRTAWLAILRAPWCGLALADLHALAANNHQSTIPECLADDEVLPQLSEEGRRRVKRTRAILEPALALRRRGRLRRRVEAVWQALGGPAVGDRAAIEDADAFLELLEATEKAGDLDDGNVLDEAIASLYARPDPEGDPRLQVMTIHKAKGLEFDTVILPGLHSGSPPPGSPLLQWMERPRLAAEPDLLMAAIRPAGRETHDPHYDFVRELAKDKEYHEQGRLLYVACTRAIRRLDLFGFVKITADNEGNPEMKAPTKGSLLDRLWPALESDFTKAFAKWRPAPETQTGKEPPPTARLHRIPADWQPPEPNAPVTWEGGLAEGGAEEYEVEYAWAGQTARITGTVTHRFLQQIATDGLDNWNDEKVEQQRPAIRAMLTGLGVDPRELQEAEARTTEALTAAITEDTGRWILSSHADAQTELALATWGSDGPETHIIDRSFIDDEGTRWIIDYKTGYRAGGDIEGFIEQELERHGPKLKRYREVMGDMEERPIRTALYYPLLRAFREVV